MAIDTKHPEYIEMTPIWHESELVMKGQRAVKSAGIKILKPTSGMSANIEKGGSSEDYESYKDRARVSDAADESLQGVMGVLFAEDPQGDMGAVVTASKSSILDLSKAVARAVYSKGRYILVIEAPADGGEPYIAEYPAECLINWKVDDSGNCTLAVFEEMIDSTDSDEYEHELESQYRVYTQDSVRIYNSTLDIVGEESRPIIAGQVSVIPIGATDIDFCVDKPPVHRIVDCVISAYRKSADYEQGLHMLAHPTPWVSGCSANQFTANAEAGLGAGAYHFLGEEGTGKTGYLEYSGNGISDLKEGMDSELQQAAEYSIKLTKVTGVESADAKEMRDKAQKSALQIMAESIDTGMNKALEILSAASGGRSFEEFKIQIQESADAEATMLTAIGNQVNSGNVPLRVMYDYARRNQMYKGTFDEWNDERMTGGVGEGVI